MSGYMLSCAFKHQIAPLLPGQSMVTRHTNTALLPRSTVRHGRQAHKQRIAPLLHGQSMVARRTNSALLPRSTDRAWSPGTQTAHCSPAPRSGHGNKAHKHRIAPLLPGQAWSPGTQTAHYFPAPRTEHGRQAHKQSKRRRLAPAPLPGQSMAVRPQNSALLPRFPDRA